MDLLRIDEIIRDSEDLSFDVKSQSKTAFVGGVDDDYSEAWLYMELHLTGPPTPDEYEGIFSLAPERSKISNSSLKEDFMSDKTFIFYDPEWTNFDRICGDDPFPFDKYDLSPSVREYKNHIKNVVETIDPGSKVEFLCACDGVFTMLIDGDFYRKFEYRDVSDDDRFKMTT